MSRVSPARTAAFRLLCRLHEKTDDLTPLPVLLEEAARHIPPRDAALAAEIVYGVLRSEARLAAATAPFLKRPAALPPRLRYILAMAVFELKELDGIPARATLDQAVQLAREQFGAGLAGLVNAVLHKVCRADSLAPGEAESPPNPADSAAVTAEEDKAIHNEDIALTASLPLWLAALWRKQYGPDVALRFARLAALRPLPALRLNAAGNPDSLNSLRALLKAEGALFFSPCTCILPSASTIPEPGTHCEAKKNSRIMDIADKAVRDGLASRQGTASQKIILRMAEQLRKMADNGSFWDACCGRGGKSCALCEQDVSPLLCSDPSERRIDFLRADAKRLGLSGMKIMSGKAQDIAVAHPCAFNGILLDAPCSGTGTLARNPELKLRLNPDKLKAAAALQSELLDAVWTSLRPGGVLIYSTCALNREENEDQITAFLSRTADARLEEQELILPEHPEEEGQDILFHALLRRSG